MYFAQLYQIWLSKQGLDLFSTRLIKIPAPKFVVFYIGNTEYPDEIKLKLSDAFISHENTKSQEGFEWTATMLNINLGHNDSLHKSCTSLYDYCSFIGKIKANLKTNMTAYSAIENAEKRLFGN